MNTFVVPIHLLVFIRDTFVIMKWIVFTFLKLHFLEKLKTRNLEAIVAIVDMEIINLDD
jgi:hypothetical protein